MDPGDDPLLQLVLNTVWSCLEDTPSLETNAVHDFVMQDKETLESIASEANITFAPGLLDVLQSDEPPAIRFFENLPTPSHAKWGIYCLVMKKPGHRDRLYVGVATDSARGYVTRFWQYAAGYSVPRYVQESLDDGFVIAHKGLLCWAAIPSPNLVSVIRVLFYELEATFCYTFWAMHVDSKDADKTEFSFWDPTTLEYDGLCSHSALKDPIDVNFNLNLTDEEIAAMAVAKKARIVKRVQRWEAEKLAADPEGWREHRRAIVRKCEQKKPKTAAQRAHRLEWLQKRVAEDVENNKYACDPCSLVVTSQHALDRHLTSSRHKTMVEESWLYLCQLCMMPFTWENAMKKHCNSDMHKQYVAAIGRDATVPTNFGIVKKSDVGQQTSDPLQFSGLSQYRKFKGTRGVPLNSSTTQQTPGTLQSDSLPKSQSPLKNDLDAVGHSGLPKFHHPAKKHTSTVNEKHDSVKQARATARKTAGSLVKALPPTKKQKLSARPVAQGSDLRKFQLPVRKTQTSIKDFFTAGNNENLAPPQDPVEDSDGDIY
jgi:hypothetical protein